MSENIRWIPRCSDKQIVRFFDRISKELDFSPFVFQIYGSIEQNNFEDNQGLLDEILSSGEFAIQRAWASRPSDVQNSQNQNRFSISFERGKKKHGVGIESSLHVDSITIEQQNFVSPKTALRINRIIEDELVARAAVPLPGGDGASLAELVQTHHQLIVALRQQLVAVGEELTRARINGEEEIRARRKELDQTAKSEQASLEEWKRAQLEDLDVERMRLAEREKQLDDRNNTHVRRELRKNLQDNLKSYKEKFELTKGTRDLRRPVWAAVMAVEVVCVVLIVIVFYSAPQGGDIWDRVAFWAKGIGLTFFGAAIAIWFLKWLTQWSARHADAEFQLRQLELDIDRASWVVETAFEWKSSQESSIPEPLLSAISRNLFMTGEARNDGGDSPADHLASALLGEASKIRLRMGDQAEAEWDRAGIKRAKRPHDG